MSKTNDTVRRIIVKPSDVWQYFVDNNIVLEGSMHLVAENDEWQVWITCDDETAVFCVEYDGDALREYTAYDESDIEEQYGFALEDIGFVDSEFEDDDESGLPSAEYSGEFDDQVCDLDIREREAELDDVCTQFVCEVLDTDYIHADDDLIEQAAKTIKEVICDIIAKQYGMKLYRPMWLVGEDGNKFFAEYPYPHIMAAEQPKKSSS